MQSEKFNKEIEINKKPKQISKGWRKNKAQS